MLTKEDKLATIYNRHTCYELTISRGQTTYLVAYTGSRSRNTLFRMLAERAQKIVALTGTEEMNFSKRSQDGATVGEWSVRWTGRTHRDAIIEGEHPYIGNYIA